MTDQTSILISDLLLKYPFARSIRVEINQGYGYGILQGLKEAKGTVIGWTHADMQTDPLDALRAFKLFEKSFPNSIFF